MGFWPALRKMKRNNYQYTVAFGGRGNRRCERTKRECRRDEGRGGILVYEPGKLMVRPSPLRAPTRFQALRTSALVSDIKRENQDPSETENGANVAEGSAH